MKIFVVCGKARHGKDTVCSIINKYYENNHKVINLQFSTYIKEYAKRICNWNGMDSDKPRKLLQELGTDIIRKKIDPNFFINRMIDDIKVYSYYFDIITISDARAKVELENLRKEFKEVVVIKVERPNFDNGLSEEEKKHFTEIDLDDYHKFDYTIINDGSIEDLEEKVISCLR